MQQFGIMHIILLLIIAGLLYTTNKYALKVNNQKFYIILLSILYTFQVFQWIIRFILGNRNAEKYIFRIGDCHLCGIVIYLLLIFFFYQNKYIFYFIIYVGPFSATCALLFPNCHGINIIPFFATHTLIMVLSIFLLKTHCQQYPVDFKSTLIALGLIAICGVANVLINDVAGTNFMYLNGSAGVATPLDAFSPNPWLKMLEVCPLFFLIELLELAIYKKLTVFKFG